MSFMRRALVLAFVLAGCVPSAIVRPTDSPIVLSASPEPAATIPPLQAAPETAGCPVTLPATSWIAGLATFTPLPRSRFSWYGDSQALAVDLPIDGVYRINPDSPNLGAKVAWWRFLTGTVDITARRVDINAPLVATTTTAGYGASGFNPSGVDFASEGCWRVTGRLQGHELSFVMLVRRAAPGEMNP